MKKFQSVTSRIATIIGLTLGAFAISAIAAGTWTPPTDIPPNGNVDAPINVGEKMQTKKGSLRLNTDFQNSLTYGLDVFGISRFFGNVEIGSSIYPATLKIVDGRQGDGKVLTSNADGVGTWKDPVSGGGGSSHFASLLQDALISYGESGARTIGDDVRDWVKVLESDSVLNRNEKYAFIMLTSGERSGKRTLGSNLGVDSYKNIVSRCYNNGAASHSSVTTYTFQDIPNIKNTFSKVSYQGTFVYNPTTISTAYQPVSPPVWGLWPYSSFPTNITYQKIANYTSDCSDAGKGFWALYIYKYDRLKTIMDSIYAITKLPAHKFNDPLSSDPLLHNNFWTTP